MADDSKSIVAEGTSFHGTVTSQCPVEVSGKVDGELSAPALEVTDSGAVYGKIKVDDLRSSGELSGDIDAGTLLLAGRVRDNTSIRAKSIEVRLSSDGSDKLAVTFGNTRLEVGDEPTKGDG